MNSEFFNIGDYSVTYGLGAAVGFGLIILLLVAVFIVLLRGNSRRVEEAARLATDGLRTNFVQQVAERDTRIQALDLRLNEQVNANANLKAEAAALRAQMVEKTKHAEESLQRFQNAREQMTSEFKAIAGDVLKSHGETFSKQNREQVDTLLKPLNDKIVEFQNGLFKDRAEMKEQIRHLSEDSLRMLTEANNLTRALKGSAQTQGAWGEMILATILEKSGLREGEQFSTQSSYTNTEARQVRTDVEVLMPNGDKLVIDSKVSLTAFESFTNADDKDERSRHLKAHISSIRGHIKGLGEKNYQQHSGSSLDYVMMFVPIEAALAAAVTEDPNIFEFGMAQGVMLTTPTTLMTILRTVRNVWDIEKRHQNAEEIAKRAGELYDKFAGFAGTMDKLDTQLERARISFDEAKGQLSTGRGNVMRRVEMLKDLGARTTKNMPEGWEDVRSTANPELPTPPKETDLN